MSDGTVRWTSIALEDLRGTGAQPWVLAEIVQAAGTVLTWPPGSDEPSEAGLLSDGRFGYQRALTRHRKILLAGANPETEGPAKEAYAYYLIYRTDRRRHDRFVVENVWHLDAVAPVTPALATALYARRRHTGSLWPRIRERLYGTASEDVMSSSAAAARRR